MKLVTFLKILVVVMGLCLVAGVLFVIDQERNDGGQEKVFPTYISKIDLLENEQVDYVVGCGKYLCVVTKGNEESPRVLVVVPKNGQIQSVVQFKS